MSIKNYLRKNLGDYMPLLKKKKGHKSKALIFHLTKLEKNETKSKQGKN